MLLLGLTLSCIISNVCAQNYNTRNTYLYPIGNSDDIYLNNQPSRNIPSSSLPQSDTKVSDDVLKQIFNTSPVKKHSVEIERSKEIYAASNVQREINERKVGNEGITTTGSRKRPQYEQRQQEQLVFRDPPELQTERTQKFNRLLYSVTNVGLNLLKNLNNMVNGNAVLSPFSISALLSLLQQGASEKTQDEITALLNMSPRQSAEEYFRITNDYKNRDSRSILKTATSVFVGENFNINRDFKTVAQTKFDSDITPSSFDIPDQAARKINKWVAQKTNNKIERLITPEILGPSTQMVLVNAIYFKGLWEIPFRVGLSRAQEFHSNNGVTKPTQFMRTRRDLNAGMDTTNNAKIVMLPFEGNQYSMMLILPSHAQGISGLLSTLNDDRLISYLSFSSVDTELEVPKFEVRVDTNLEEVLRQMGVREMFGPNANLTKLGSNLGYSNSPQISSAVHSALLSIDEHGARAAAATASAAVALSYDEPSFTFIADRPFLAILWDTATALPLFMAKIEDPLQ